MIEKGGANLGRARVGRLDDDTKLANPRYMCDITHISWYPMDRNEVERDDFVGSLHRFFWIGKIYLKHRKCYEFCTNSQDRNHQEYQPTRKSRLHRNIKFLTKTHIFYTKTSKTPTFPKSHQTPRKYWNHTKHHQNTQITPKTPKHRTSPTTHPQIFG